MLPAALRQRAVLGDTAHRPWPTPDRPWFMGQSWENLLFAHWRLPPEALERVVPPQLPLDTFEGGAWVGVTPFRVSGLRLHWTPPAPLLSSFPEINVRTYVTVGGRPGIYFLSLDADSRSAVATARRVYRLPYFRSRISTNATDGTIAYSARRISSDGDPAEFGGSYRATGPAFNAEPGSLAYFLTERYCLYTLDEQRRVWRGEIHHPPWPQQPAEAEIERNTMGRPFGLELDGEPALHFSALQDVVLWRLARA